MAILPKEYLSFVDVAQYFNHMDLFYHLGSEHDINQLRDDLWDLIAENKLEPYFYCNSYNYEFEPINKHLKLNTSIAYTLLRTDREYKLDEIKVNFNNEATNTKLLEPLDLDFYDLKFKRTDLDKLFEGELFLPSEEYLKAEVYELEEEIKLLKAQLKEQINMPVNAAIDEGQGDTLLILGAVMECIKEVAKPNYTQQSLIDAITQKYKNTPSLSESTLTKKFPKAKTYLKQNVTP